MPRFFHFCTAAAITCLTLLPGLAAAQAPLRQDPHQHHHEGIDPNLLIKANDAHGLMQKKAALFVDVRSRTEYNASHIQGALSYPYPAIRDGNNYPFKKDKKLILYCGCPHHLSGMSAEVLKQKGYADVHVIDEGFWGWKTLGFPVVVNPDAPARLSMDIQGRLMQGEQAVAYRDILLIHPETEQIEATRTDADGFFRMALHFGGVKLDDAVVFQLDKQNLSRLRLSELQDKQVVVQVPLQVALQ